MTSFKGKLHERAAQVLKQSLEDCALLGDVDTQALLLVEGSQLKSRRSRGDDGMSLLQVSTQHIMRNRNK